MRHVLLVFALVVFAMPAMGQQCATTHELTGFTSATMIADGTGVLGLTLACQAEFGSSARTCTSLEVMRTTNVPSGLTGDAWVLPSFQPGAMAYQSSSSSSITKRQALDASGLADTPRDFTVDGWSGGDDGLTVDAVGVFGQSPGYTSLSVSCCVPIPETTVAVVPTLLPWLRGLLIGTLMLAAGTAILARRVVLLNRGVQQRPYRGLFPSPLYLTECLLIGPKENAA